jgi:hypothetical protein
VAVAFDVPRRVKLAAIVQATHWKCGNRIQPARFRDLEKDGEMLQPMIKGHAQVTNVDDGVYIERLPKGTRLAIQTSHREYLIEVRGGLSAWISGHPDYCPEPVPVLVRGSRRRGSNIQPRVIGRGMRLEFWDPTRGVITTSVVLAIRKLHR